MTVEERLRDVADRPGAHLHGLVDLILCCMGEDGFVDAALFEAHDLSLIGRGGADAGLRTVYIAPEDRRGKT